MQSLTPGSGSPSGEAVLAAPTASLPSRSAQALVKTARLIRRYPFPALMMLVLLVIGIASGLATWIAPFDPNAVDPINRLQAPSGTHIMGTDAVGRDVFSRVVYGARISLMIGFLAVAIAISIGTAVGAIAGNTGRGAAAGAAAGGLMGGMRRRDSNRQQQQWGQEQAANYQSNRNNWTRAFTACMESRGYTVG